MMLKDLKFTETELGDKDISSLPDRPSDAGITAEELKARFDMIPKTLLALGKFNQMIDELGATEEGNSGADNIGVSPVVGTSGGTLQAVLGEMGDLTQAAKQAGEIAAAQGAAAVTAADNATAAANAATEKAANAESAAEIATSQGKEAAAAATAATAAIIEVKDYAAEQAQSAKDYVDQVILEGGVVSSVFGRAGIVTAEAGDYTAEQVSMAGYDSAAAAITEAIDTADAAKAVTDTAGAANGLATLDENGKLKQMPTADDVGAIPSEQKGVAGGVATLDSSGKLKEMPTPADIGAVNKAGDTMTGVLNITQDNIGTSRFWGSKFGTYITTDPIGIPQYQLCLNRMADDVLPNTLKTALYLAVSNDGIAWNEAYNLLHTGNKPIGSYTGNGSSAERTIDTGGIGNAIAIWSSIGVAYITPAGGFYGTNPTSNAVHFGSETATFIDGVLTLKSVHAALNKSEQTYYYQVL